MKKLILILILCCCSIAQASIRTLILGEPSQPEIAMLSLESKDITIAGESYPVGLSLTLLPGTDFSSEENPFSVRPMVEVGAFRIGADIHIVPETDTIWGFCIGRELTPEPTKLGQPYILLTGSEVTYGIVLGTEYEIEPGIYWQSEVMYRSVDEVLEIPETLVSTGLVIKF